MPKMQELVRFFTTVSSWADAGKVLEQGGFTQFGERGLFEQSHSGLLYADARAIAGVELPERALSAIFASAQEIRAAVEYGTYRVLLRIGAQLRLFPFPTWGALDRPSAITPRESESALAKVTRLRLPSASFFVAGQRICLSLPRDETSLSNALHSLPPTTAFALLTRPAPSANAVLTWRPGQQEMSGFSPDGSDRSRLSGCFMVFVPSAARDDARPLEDGYAVLCSSDLRARLITALAEHRPLSLPLGDSKRFELEWQ